MFSIPVYSSGSIPEPSGWRQPTGWTGPQPVLHLSFDNLDGLMLMEGTEQKDYDALTQGKVGHNNTSFGLKFFFNMKSNYLFSISKRGP